MRRVLNHKTGGGAPQFAPLTALPDGGIGDYVPKPKWMRLRTYDRKLEEIFAAEEVVDAHLLGFVRKLERLGR